MKYEVFRKKRHGRKDKSIGSIHVVGQTAEQVFERAQKTFGECVLRASK